MCRNEKGESVELSHSTFSSFLHSPSRSGPPPGVSPVLRAVSRAREFAGGRLLKLGAKGRLLRQGPRLPERPRSIAVSTTTCRWPCTTISSPPCAASCRPSTAISTCAAARCGSRDIHHYDTYVPILSELESRHTWKQAVDVVVTSLAPLGDEYCRVLARRPRRPLVRSLSEPGQAQRRVQLRLVRRLAVHPHELPAGRARPRVHAGPRSGPLDAHAIYSAKHQPFEYYNYTIFVAEVASTFNEQLLSRHLLERAKSDQQRAYLINREIDAIRGTIIRQTMFAEFEKITHAWSKPASRSPSNASKPNTANCWPITSARTSPSTTSSSSNACASRTSTTRSTSTSTPPASRPRSRSASASLSGGKKELDDYLSFLKGGCSKWPLDLLKDAGVDMTSPEPVETALSYFERLVRRTRRTSLAYRFAWTFELRSCCQRREETVSNAMMSRKLPVLAPWRQRECQPSDNAR